MTADSSWISNSAIAQEAISKWEDLTGLSLDATSFRFGDLDLHRMNTCIRESLELDPDGVTSLLLLEVFLRSFLEEKTFTAASIMRDYKRLSTFLEKAEALFSLLQSDRMIEISSGLRGRIADGLRRYGAEGERFDTAIQDPDLIPILRRDALRSMKSLEAFQFLDGEPGQGNPQAFHHIHMAWDINELLHAVRDMPHSGIAVVLMRDPGHTNRSYFVFAMRNGGSVTLFTDRSRPAYPGQDDVLSGRGGRFLSRQFAARENSNHFPYQIIPTSLDEKGDVVFEKETAPIQHGPRLVPLMSISDLPEHQSIWITMMLSLIQERFWTQGWKAPALSYTASMITDRQSLIKGAGSSLALVSDYREISLEPVRICDLSPEKMQEAGTKITDHRVNAWIEERYRDLIDQDILNLRDPDDNSCLLLLSPVKDQERGVKDVLVPVSGKVFSYNPKSLTFRSDKPVGYPLYGMKDSMFGTERELADDRLFVARRNMAAALQSHADLEFSQRKDEILSWFEGRLRKNIDGIFSILRSGDQHYIADARYRSNLFALDQAKSETFRYDHGWGSIILGEKDYRGSPLCILTEAKPTYRASFSPRAASDLAMLAGCDVDDLPDVIRNWLPESPYVGNHLLDRIDPVESELKDPWIKLKFKVNIFLSKRGYKTVMSGQKKDAPENGIQGDLS